MVLNAIRRILVAVVLCLGATGAVAAPAYADTAVVGEPSGPFTPPYQAG
jgi:hypothetical protein